jgi:hypothetical protein
VQHSTSTVAVTRALDALILWPHPPRARTHATRAVGSREAEWVAGLTGDDATDRKGRDY